MIKVKKEEIFCGFLRERKILKGKELLSEKWQIQAELCQRKELMEGLFGKKENEGKLKEKVW
jgi:hypothetical protein